MSVNLDEQAVRFASKRYPLANLSIEFEPTSPIDALVGETDGAFDACVCLGVPARPEHRALRIDLLRELWRVLATGGWLLVGVDNGQPSPLSDDLREDLRSLPGLHLVEPAQPGPFADTLAHKAIERPAQDP